MTHPNGSNNGFRAARHLENESLEIFIRNMARFDQEFCDHLAAGTDFTLRLEVHGAAGELIHCRVYTDGFDRPAGVDRRTEHRRRGVSAADR